MYTLIVLGQLGSKMVFKNDKNLQIKLPKYKQIALSIKKSIVDGQLGHNGKLATVRELATLYNTTKATIQQALTQLANEGLIDRQQGSGIFVKVSRQKTLAVVFDRQITDPNTTMYCSQLLIEVENSLAESGWSRKCYIDVSSKTTADEFEQAVLTHRFDGLIVCSRWVAENYLPRLAKAGIPCVGAYPYQTMDRWVFFNYNECSQRGVNELVKMGAQRIALVAGHDPQGIQQEMEKGYRQGLLEAQRPMDDPMVRVVPVTEEDGFRAFNELWDQSVRPDGIIITDELICKGVIRGVISRGIKIPEELHIASQMTAMPKNPFALPVIQLQMDVAEQASKLVQMIFALSTGQPVSMPKVLLSPKIYNPFEGD
jgi:DNA-binding LacI/PurR family transcriptional regulator